MKSVLTTSFCMFVWAVFVILLSAGNAVVSGACPTADLSGDCKVDLADVALLAEQWLTTYNTDDLANITSLKKTQLIARRRSMKAGVALKSGGENGFIGYIHGTGDTTC